MNHHTGYYCYIGGDRYWHRTFEGAMERATAKSNFYAADITQVIKVTNGERLWGQKA